MRSDDYFIDDIWAAPLSINCITSDSYNMTIEDIFFEDILAEFPSNNCITSGDNAMESNRELLQPENAISEAQEDEQLSRSSGANTKRKRQSKAKGKSTTLYSGESSASQQPRKRQSKAKGKSTILYNGESSASQQPEPNKKEKSLKELIEKNSIAEVIKALKDRLSRRKDKDEKADMFSSICLMSELMANNVVSLFAPVVDSIKEIKKQWPARSDLQDIKKIINGIVDEVKAAGIEKMKATDEMKPRLLEVGEKIERSYEQRRQDSTKVKNLEPFFTTEGVSVETLREKLSSAFPWLFLGEIPTNGPTTDQDQGSLQTREQLQYTVLENELFAKDNNKVDVSDFEGLEEEIKKSTGRNIPDYLEIIASKIKNARGKATEFAHINIQVLVCAAIQEMEDLPVENLDWGMLKKWGATFNKAKELGFQVKFAEIELKKNLYAYFGHSKVIGHRK